VHSTLTPAPSPPAFPPSSDRPAFSVAIVSGQAFPSSPDSVLP
jgi:hypothetical protein